MEQHLVNRIRQWLKKKKPFQSCLPNPEQHNASYVVETLPQYEFRFSVMSEQPREVYTQIYESTFSVVEE